MAEMNANRRFCPGICALAFFSCALSLQARDAAQAPAGEIVELPKYEVRGDRVLPPPESWRYARAPDVIVTIGARDVAIQGFEVLSNLSVRNTGVFVRELQLRQLAGALFWPALAGARADQPPVILVDKFDDPLPPDGNWREIEWDGIQVGNASKKAHSTYSGFANGPDWGAPRDYAVNPGVFINPADLMDAAGASGGLDAADAQVAGSQPRLQSQGHGDANPLPPRTVGVRGVDGVVTVRVRAGDTRFHEERLAGEVNGKLLARTLENMSPRPPQWLRTGLAWLISTMEVSPHALKLGASRLEVSKSSAALAPLKLVLNDTGEDTGKKSRQAHAGELTSIAFVHYCLFGDGARHANAFAGFVARIGSGPVTEDVFKQCFGMTFAKMDRVLDAFATDAAVTRQPEMRGKIPPMPAAPVREATQGEAARLQADVYFAGNAPQPALDILRIAYWRGERDMALISALAFAEARAGDLARAHTLLARVMSGPEPPARAFLAEARLQYREAKESPAWKGRFAQAQTVAILTLLAKAARKSARPGEELCELFARVVLEGEGAPDGAIPGFLKESARLYPGNEIIANALDGNRGGGLQQPDNAGAPHKKAGG